jgi:signal transduction histidine kinase
LRLRRDKLPPEAVQDMLESVAEEAERLYRLVEDLLAIARTEMSEPVEREPVAIGMLIEQAVAGFRRGSGRVVEIRVAEELPPVLGEPTYLAQVITNLLSNANKYSPPDQPIEVEVTVGAGDVTVGVLDRGEGVAQEELDQIFDRFYRAPGAAEQASGKGLGLTVCKRLVEALSGRIWAENRPGAGLAVFFTLEMASNPEQEEPAPAVSSAAEAG